MIRVLGRRNSMNVQKVMWALGELGLDYQRDDVAGSFGLPDGYATQNPNQTVPTLQDNGLTLWESNACVRYLARTYGHGVLWPEDAAALAVADQWMDWQQTTLAPPFFQIFINEIRVPPDKRDAAAVAAGVERCARLFRMLDEQLGATDFLAGRGLSMADIPVGTMTYRYFAMDIRRPELPHLEAWYARLCERPAYRKHVMIAFGTNHEEWLAEERRNAGIQ
jgi:glutathione S-transferase